MTLPTPVLAMLSACLLAASALWAWQGQGGGTFEERCATLPAPAVSLRITNPEEGQVQRYTLADEHLKPQSAESVYFEDSEETKSMVAGYVQLALTPVFSVSTESKRDWSTGARCFSVETDIALKTEPLDIHVVEGLEPGSCPYEEVLTHERKHIRRYQEVLSAEAPWLEARIEDAFARSGDHVAQPGDSLSDAARAAVKEAISTAIREAYSRWNADHRQQLDSAEEYDRFTASCDGETEFVLNKIRARYEVSQARAVESMVNAVTEAAPFGEP